jgi:hypothetical protein
MTDGTDDIDGAVAKAHDHAEQGVGAEALLRQTLPLIAIGLKDLRRLAEATERLAAALDGVGDRRRVEAVAEGDAGDGEA